MLRGNLSKFRLETLGMMERLAVRQRFTIEAFQIIHLTFSSLSIKAAHTFHD